MEPKTSLNVVLLKTKRADKSSSATTIQASISQKTTKSVSYTVCGIPVTVYDTPEFITDMREEDTQQIYEKIFQKCKTGTCVFLLVITIDRYTEEERETVEKIEKLLGENRLNKTWILFTGGEQLETKNMTIKEFIDESEPLKKLIKKYDQRYCVSNDKSKEHTGLQFKMLLVKMIQTSLGLKASEGGRLTRQILAIRSSDPDEQQTPVVSLSYIRIVLLGKTGSGKSAAGNTILGRKEFKSAMRMNSITCECSEKQATVSDRKVSVVDTPGFFDTERKHEELMIAIAKSVYMCSPGPHAFLIVFPVNMRFTEQEETISKQVEMLFGEEVLKYSIVIFTHGDMLEEEPVEEVIKENSRLRHLIQQCGGKYHVLNNRDQNNREQVNDLLKKIDTMIKQNGGGHYSNQMFEDAMSFKSEEEKRRQRDEEERKQVLKQAQEHIEGILREAQRDIEFYEFYKQYERRFSFSAFVMSKLEDISIGVLCGGFLGAALGIVAGPAGVLVGAMAGAAAGAALGTAFSL